MSKEVEASNNGQSDQEFEPLGSSAYVVVAKANCLYEPRAKSAVRVAPYYGTEVVVVREEGSWVLVRFCDKEAWSPRGNLSTDLLPQKPVVDVGIVPPPNYDFKSPNSLDAWREPDVEYGPRGGRFVRNASGFRRYF